MATAQTSQSKSSPKSRKEAAREQRNNTEEISGERDEHYNLISVLYHGLQGADQCEMYADDAEEGGDDELAEFLRSAGQTQAQLAKQAKALLIQRLGQNGGTGRGRRAAASEDEDEEDDE